jgi:hypothetical protein
VTWPRGDPNVVAERVLADSAYRSVRPAAAVPPRPSLLGDALKWTWHHLIAPLLHPLAHALAATRGAGTVTGFILVAAALLGLAFVAFRFALALAAGPASAGRRSGPGRALEFARGASEWRALARAFAGQGEYARAIAALFSAALAELDERAVVAFDAARTPGEYRRLVRRARAAAATPFDELSERFNRALYAADPPAAAEYAAAERALAALAPALSA